jgi:phage shock protein PspC (stress-responsive transcriptional regulator)
MVEQNRAKFDRGGNMATGRDKLHRSSSNRIIAGVCGGIAQWLGWSPTTVRVLYVVVSILSVAFPGILVYLILWIAMPQD